MQSEIDYYEGLLAEHGDSPKALDWSEEGQRDRFRVIYAAGIEDGDSITDLGCGLGHFYRHLQTRCEWAGGYVGIDQSAALVEVARSRYPEASFVVGNAFTESLGRSDWAIASGLLNVKLLNPMYWAVELLKRSLAIGKKGAAVNFLSDRAPAKRSDRNYFSAPQLLNIALDMSPYVTLRHDYRDNDFTLYLYHEKK